MADLFEKDGVKLRKDFKAVEDTVVVDRDELVQAVTNMLRNSLQAINSRDTEHIPGEVVLHTENNDGSFVLQILDNGIGITEENQKKLFESQFSTKKPEEGTGLGLSIARRFVRGFGGDIHLQSSVPGDKTVFCLQIPLAKPNEEAA